MPNLTALLSALPFLILAGGHPVQGPLAGTGGSWEKAGLCAGMSMKAAYRGTGLSKRKRKQCRQVLTFESGYVLPNACLPQIQIYPCISLPRKEVLLLFHKCDGRN